MMLGDAMRAVILSVADKRHMSMSAQYEKYLKSRKIEYDIIRINRYDKTENIEDNVYEYSFNKSTSVSKIQKIKGFLGFRKYAINIIKKNKYDFIIVWNENTAVLFSDMLCGKYKGRYCLNIRDQFELKLLMPIFDKTLKNAYFITSPSIDFKFPGKCYTLFNRDPNIVKNVSKKAKFKQKGEKINIVFMGLYHIAPRTFENTVDIFANDERFQLYFYGEGFDTELKNYVDNNNIKNVITGGAFPYEKTYEYLQQTDIINSYYNNFDRFPNLKAASGVKQSYTPMLYLPAINDKDTTWGRISEKYGFSYLISDDNISTLADDLYNWYINLDFNKFKQGCDEFNKVIDKSISDVYALLDEYFKCKE